MSNKRVFWPLQQGGFAKDGFNTFIPVHGLQSIGITTNFSLEQIFELGQLAIYQNIENIPDIEVTMEKVLDGYPLLYHLATNGAVSGTLNGRSNVKTIVGMSVFSDTQDQSSGTPIAEVRMSGIVTSAISYTFPVDGNSTESWTGVGNHKLWIDVEGGGTAFFSGAFNNNDAPLNTGALIGVQRREAIVFTAATGPGTTANPTPPAAALDANGQTNQWTTVLPTDIYGITPSGTNPLNADGTHVVSIQSITISADLGRDQIFELGRKSPYLRYVTFPVEVRTEIEVTSKKFDNISATEAGGNNGAAAGSNTRNQTIRVRTLDGTMVDCGTKNRLASVTWGGGDSGGGNVTNRYSYTGFNDLIVSSPVDPSGL
jgi:hypothetical protein